MRGFAITCALEALCLAVPYALGDRVVVLALLLRPLGGVGLVGLAAGWAVVASVVILPAALVSGWQFPLLVSLLGTGGRRVGRDVARAYAWNTAGAIAGSLAGGFSLLPLLTAPGVWRAAVVLLAVVGHRRRGAGGPRRRAVTRGLLPWRRRLPRSRCSGAPAGPPRRGGTAPSARAARPTSRPRRRRTCSATGSTSGGARWRGRPTASRAAWP